MFVFEVIVPGTWLDYEDREWAWKIQNQLDSLQSRFFEANLALNLFTSTKNVSPRPSPIEMVSRHVVAAHQCLYPYVLADVLAHPPNTHTGQDHSILQIG